MSQARRERQQERLGIKTSNRNWRRIAVYVVAIAVAGGLAAYGVNRYRHQHNAFARCLTERGIKMYGAWWCPHCIEQKEKFGASVDQLPYIECGVKGDTRQKTQVCKDAGISHYPTWQFPPLGERVERVFTPEELSDRTGCALP